ncbi:hypothetical protein Taro_050932 [Colocasia esculenta]|uniref:Protein kinase domain-containing protein n=1 Tax=Colocasia esculenta TaxID=4460 RepID=A0A843XFF2_COLES|nr:hypothetical protein [Colocasia esculenta]
MALRSLLFFSFLLLPALGQQPGGSDDLRSLLEFKKGFHDDPSGLVLASWNPASTAGGGCPSSWHGVACDGNGAVVGVALDGLGLNGNLKFATLLGMRSLRNLSLSGNNFTGRLVPAIGAMTSLQHLDLSGNRFYGPIPERITELWGLVYLNLSYNGFSGVFPSGLWKLQQLRVLDLRSNALRGDVGALLSELRNVEHLDLSYNEFYGGLSMGLANLSSLAITAKHVNLSSNKLSGVFFTGESLQLFKNLEILDVGDNQLTGELSSFEALTNLRVLHAGKNQLYGSLPLDLVGSSMALVELDLSGNGFTGKLLIVSVATDLKYGVTVLVVGPIFNINSTSLKILNLSSNALSGSLPSNIGSCSTLDLSTNMISGDLSPMQKWGAMLEIVDLSSNLLSGSLPNLTSQFEVLTSIKIRNNSLLGMLPSVVGGSPKLSVLDLSLNNLTGPLLPSLFTSSSLTYLNLSGNHFTGTLPIQMPHSTESLVLPSVLHMEFLDLYDNSLSGPLPAEIVQMQKLKLLDLGKNSFSGEIPTEIGKLPDLEVLDLSMNHFKGQIPDMPQPSLKSFNVSYNDLSGLVPENLRKFRDDSFHPGNALLVLPNGVSGIDSQPGFINNEGQGHHSKSRVRIAIIVGSIGAVVLIFFIFMAVYKIRTQELCGRNGFSGHTSGRDVKLGRFIPPNFFRSHKNDAVTSSVSFSNDHLLTSAAQAMPAHKEIVTETVERGFSVSREVGSEAPSHCARDGCASGGGFNLSPGFPLNPSAPFVNADFTDQPVVLDVYSPDRLAGELFFLDTSLAFNAENLSRAPAEVLGRSSHGTSYKATLHTGHVLTVKWLRVGLVRRKKEFAKEVKRIGSIQHPNIIPLRGYYWGPREQERLILSDYVYGDSLALHLHDARSLNAKRNMETLEVTWNRKRKVGKGEGDFQKAGRREREEKLGAQE